MGEKVRLSRADAAERARATLLEVGRQMVAEQPVNSGLDHIKVAEVARRANMTTGAIYHHWDSQDAYRAELMDLLLAPITLQNSELMGGALELVLAGELTLEELSGLVAWDNLTQLVDNERFDVQLGFWSRRSDPEIARRLRASYRELADRRAESTEAFLAAFGRRVKPPLTVDDFSTVISALAEGLAIRRGVDPDAVPVKFPELASGRPVVEKLRALADGRFPDDATDPGRLNLLAVAGMALVEHLTEPIPTDE
jgi:AcrR family transcriptional regulator